MEKWECWICGILLGAALTYAANLYNRPSTIVLRESSADDFEYQKGYSHAGLILSYDDLKKGHRSIPMQTDFDTRWIRVEVQ